MYDAVRARDATIATLLHDAPKRAPYVLSELRRAPRRAAGPERAEQYVFRIGVRSQGLARVLADCFPPEACFPVGEARFRVEGVRPDLAVPPARGWFRTLSPVLLRDRGRSVVADGPGYVARVQRAVDAQVVQYGALGCGVSRVRVPAMHPLGVQRRTIRGHRVLAQDALLWVEGPEAQVSLLVDHGIGLSPALAFGMVAPACAGDVARVRSSLAAAAVVIPGVMA